MTITGSTNYVSSNPDEMYFTNIDQIIIFVNLMNTKGINIKKKDLLIALENTKNNGFNLTLEVITSSKKKINIINKIKNYFK